MKKRERTWKPERLIVEDYWSIVPREVEFFEAICALAGSTKGCVQGFKRSHGGEEIWRKICSLYEYFLDAARSGGLTVKGDLKNYPATAIEVGPKIENNLLCTIMFRDLVHFSYINRVAVPWVLQTAMGMHQSTFLPPAVSVSVAIDKRSIGGKCTVSGISFPLDFEVHTDILTKRDKAKLNAQAAAIALVNLYPQIDKKKLKTEIKTLPLIGEIIKEFFGEHTLRVWLKGIVHGESKKGRPPKTRFISSPPKNLELPINQTRLLYSPLASEIKSYLARLKTAIAAIAATLATKTSLSENEIFSHELIQNLLHPVCIQVNQIEKKWEWAKSWIRTAVEEARKK